MNSPRLLIASAGVALLTVLSACGTTSGPTASDGTSDDTQQIRAVTAVYPYQWLVEQIGGDAVQVEPLLEAGADAHDLELTPRQVVSISEEADLVVYEEGLIPPVDDALAGGIRGTALNGGSLVPELETADAHSEEEEGEEEHADPHVWLAPTNMITIAEGIRDELSRLAPDEAESFASNTDRVTAELTALDEQFTTGLAQCEINVFIPSHEAFGYLADSYGLEQVAVRGLDSSVEPSAARIAEIQQTAQREGVTTIFYETTASPEVSEAIARDTGLSTDVLDPIESPAADDSRGTDYPARMQANLESLRTANRCA